MSQSNFENADVLSNNVDQVDDLRANIVAESSRKIYTSSMIKFMVWLWSNHHFLLTNECSILADAALDKVEFFKSYLKKGPESPPIDFDNLTPGIFLNWVLDLRKVNGENPGSSTYNSHRSSLFNFFRAYRKVFSRDFEKELASLYKGLKRKVASNIAAGGGKIRVGKDPLAFSLYTYLGLVVLKIGNREAVFARTFMILAWNLMARSANVFEICISHMEWREDALCIFFLTDEK